ncbi:hypothetical protein HN587_01115 [Candidatus Woesearchaeota archaeon]|jgi:hypothetical protein|nr:hypothetical protein [Candidatus Woesearchaeota archaeon]
MKNKALELIVGKEAMQDIANLLYVEYLSGMINTRVSVGSTAEFGRLPSFLESDEFKFIPQLYQDAYLLDFFADQFSELGAFNLMAAPGSRMKKAFEKVSDVNKGVAFKLFDAVFEQYAQSFFAISGTPPQYESGAAKLEFLLGSRIFLSPEQRDLIIESEIAVATEGKPPLQGRDFLTYSLLTEGKLMHWSNFGTKRYDVEGTPGTQSLESVRQKYVGTLIMKLIEAGSKNPGWFESARQIIIKENLGDSYGGILHQAYDRSLSIKSGVRGDMYL